jgi:hypothetical protein
MNPPNSIRQTNRRKTPMDYGTSPLADLTAEQLTFLQDDFADRTAAGAAFLTNHLWNWRQRVNLAALEMRSPTNSILGQVFGSIKAGYFFFHNTLGPNTCPADFGLDVPGDAPVELYDLLTDAWRAYLHSHASV